jgi:hypothetical protein
MTDYYIDEPQGGGPDALSRVRAGLSRSTSRLEHAIQASAANVMDETRLVAHKARREINSQLGFYAACAFGAGVGLGLLAAVIASLRARR